jgi:trans-aconitate methyltransferase
VVPDDYLDSFDTPKYRTKNPIARAAIRRFTERIHAAFVQANPARRILEIGVGEGYVSGYLSERFPEKEFTGIDTSEPDLRALRAKFPRIDARRGSIYDLRRLNPPYDLVLCCEVLEHLPDPALALENIGSMGAKHFIFSVPHEPWFMLSNLARMKNLLRLGNDPGHINHWGPRTFAELLSDRFEIVEMIRSYPWLIALTRPRTAGARATVAARPTDRQTVRSAAS